MITKLSFDFIKTAMKYKQNLLMIVAPVYLQSTEAESDFHIQSPFRVKG